MIQGRERSTSRTGKKQPGWKKTPELAQFTKSPRNDAQNEPQHSKIHQELLVKHRKLVGAEKLEHTLMSSRRPAPSMGTKE